MLARWEAMPPRTQAYVGFPVLAVVTFLLNAGPFAQPLVRALIYGVVEGAFFTWLLVLATRNEMARRRAAESEGQEEDPPAPGGPGSIHRP